MIEKILAVKQQERCGHKRRDEKNSGVAHRNVTIEFASAYQYYISKDGQRQALQLRNLFYSALRRRTAEVQPRPTMNTNIRITNSAY